MHLPLFYDGAIFLKFAVQNYLNLDSLKLVLSYVQTYTASIQKVLGMVLKVPQCLTSSA